MGWEVKVKRVQQKFWRHLETRSFCYCLFNSRFTALLVNLFLQYTVKLDEFICSIDLFFGLIDFDTVVAFLLGCQTDWDCIEGEMPLTETG